MLDVTRGGQPLVWLKEPLRAPRNAAVDRLAGLDALHREERILYRGVGFLAGRVEIDGALRKVRVPLVSGPVHLNGSWTGYQIVPAGDVTVTPLVTDRELAAGLEAAPAADSPRWIGAVGSRAWLTSIAEATGLPFDGVIEGGQRVPSDRLVLIEGTALFVVRDVYGPGLGDSLRSWAGRDLDGTALAAVYGEQRTDEGGLRAVRQRAGKAGDGGTGDGEVLSPLPLSRDQVRVVARARTAPVTVVSGPPGNGKSHTVVAAALEVVHRGGSVLIATQSPHAAEVLAGLLGRYPGPAPVLFGAANSRDAVELLLTSGAEDGADDSRLAEDRRAVERAHQRVSAIRAEITAALRTEVLAGTVDAGDPRLAGLLADVPGAFDASVDLDRVERARNAGTDGGWWARWTGRRARRQAYRVLGLRDGVPPERVTEALTVATAQRAAARLALAGGTDLSADWARLHDAEAALQQVVGAAMRRAARSQRRWDADGRRATVALATALRAGRSRRRELLARLDAGPLVQALPLWIGTVTDVEDLLPSMPGLFELVVIDEASHVDQIRAAPVLARARRALVVGDPRQLRFVSFVADADVAGVLQRHGADDRLDVRRNSAYDVAAGAAPVTWLTEHYRGAPHLIGFSARRFYDDRITVTTRTPAADTTDAIDVVAVPAATVTKGVNQAEVAAALQAVAALVAEGHHGIAVISPFRAQAEALEAALIDAYPVEKLTELGLRVGTVHSFQGSEAGAVVVSLGLVDGDAAGRRRFVTDPHLFNVMITRARRKLVVLSSLTAPNGLLGDYLRYAAGPDRPMPALTASGWAAQLATELDRAGVPVRPGYQVGSWRLDLCAGPPDTAVGIVCDVHPDGPEAHLDRQRSLHRAGWRLLDVFASRWGDDPRRAALEVAAAIARDEPGTIEEVQVH